MPSIVRCRVIVRGRVQGVFFRDSCQRHATTHGVRGWVRNRDDGTVEAAFEGDEMAVSKLVEWCRHGPPRAEVTGLDIVDEEPAGERGFVVRGW